MTNYPCGLAKGVSYQSHTGRLTGLWFLLKLAQWLNTNKKTETSSVYDCTVEDVELRYSHILFFCEEH